MYSFVSTVRIFKIYYCKAIPMGYKTHLCHSNWIHNIEYLVSEKCYVGTLDIREFNNLSIFLLKYMHISSFLFAELGWVKQGG